MRYSDQSLQLHHLLKFIADALVIARPFPVVSAGNNISTPLAPPVVAASIFTAPPTFCSASISSEYPPAARSVSIKTPLPASALT